MLCSVDSKPLLELDWNNFPVDTVALNCFLVLRSIVSSRWVPKINNQKDFGNAGLPVLCLVFYVHLARSCPCRYFFIEDSKVPDVKPSLIIPGT
jgi:hypothetical protein